MGGENMVHWHLPKLIEQVRRESNEPLSLPQIAHATGLAVSTIYILVEHPPKRVDTWTLNQLLIFLSHHLGPLSMNDLLEFEFPEGS
jgi:hypothetical protein